MTSNLGDPPLFGPQSKYIVRAARVPRAVHKNTLRSSLIACAQNLLSKYIFKIYISSFTLRNFILFHDFQESKNEILMGNKVFVIFALEDNEISKLYNRNLLAFQTFFFIFKIAGHTIFT